MGVFLPACNCRKLFHVKLGFGCFERRVRERKRKSRESQNLPQIKEEAAAGKEFGSKLKNKIITLGSIPEQYSAVNTVVEVRSAPNFFRPPAFPISQPSRLLLSY